MQSSMFMETESMSMAGAMTEMSGLDLGDTAVLNTSMSTDDMASSADRGTRLKAAFALCCKQEMSQSQSLVDQLFPMTLVPGQDSLLDVAISGLSQELIDDYPASDPRWAESRPLEGVTISGPGIATASLLLLYQLEDKHKGEFHDQADNV
jgi:nuclear pore complex protein Nup133